MMASIYTNDILDILDSYNVKAHFLWWKRRNQCRRGAARIVDEGHTLECIHTVINIRNCTNQWTVLQDFVRSGIHLSGTGVESVCYRFGWKLNTVSEIDMHDFIDYLDSQGVEYYDWNVSSETAEA